VNQAVGGAMLTGFKKSLELHSDITIKMDGDNQMDSSYIHELIKPITENEADFTKGNRFRDFSALKTMPLSRRLGNLGLSFCIHAFRIASCDDWSHLRRCKFCEVRESTHSSSNRHCCDSNIANNFRFPIVIVSS